ncbi:MAG TPA: DUF2600 family protein [Solirubrobacteraceae bacterium]|nr:DUF2600 family protein [Solirubrobacteraceae bacterium]
MSGLGDRRLVARAGLALALANARYWFTVAPLVRGQLRRWERRARAISDPDLRALALEKLHTERFHAEAAAMVATRAPRAHREHVVEAIVALELLFDYLDGVTERPSPDPMSEGERLFKAFTDAVELRPDGSRDDGREHPDDSGYLEELSGAVRVALARLPGAWAIADLARRSAARSAQAQIRMHAAPYVGTAQLEAWARSEATGTGLEWRELLAGAASSVLALHALIAAAADARTNQREAGEIEAAYLSICVLLTLLDSLADYEQDTSTGERGYISFYKDRDVLAQALARVARRATGQARELRDGPHHVMMLVGVVAYYTSSPGAGSAFAQPVAKRLNEELRPLIVPTLAIMHTWRLAKRARGFRLAGRESAHRSTVES